MSVLTLACSSAAQQQADVLSTFRVLSLAPESAMATFALPPLTRLNDKVLTLVSRFSTAGGDGKAVLDTLLTQLASWTGSPDGMALPAMFQANGFNPDMPCGLFVDFSPLAMRAQSACDATESGRVALCKVRRNTPGTLFGDWLDLDKANMLVVAGCADPKRAETQVRRLLAALDGPQTAQPAADGAQSYGRLGYCVTDEWVFLTNHMPMLAGALARLKAPAPVYRCPGLRGNEIVLMTRLDRLTALMPRQSASFSYDVFLDGALAGDIMRAGLCPGEVFGGDEPNVTTLDLEQDRIELISRLNLLTHPRYAAYIGEPKPIRLAGLLPEDCLAFACVGLNDAIRNIIEHRWILFLDPTQKDSGRFDPVREIFGLLANEVVAGISPGTADTPAFFLAADITQPDAIKSFVERLAPTVGWEGQEGGASARFTQLNLPAIAPLHLALTDRAVMLSNDPEGCRAMAGRLLSGARTRLLEFQTPPIDPEAGIFSLFSFKTEVLATVIPFLKGMPGGEGKWTRPMRCAGCRPCFAKCAPGKRFLAAGKNSLSRCT